MDVPAAQLATAKIGDIVQGQMARPLAEGFHGEGLGPQVSEATGAVTIRVLSDKYIQPGTVVSGRVGNAMFKGMVAQSPSEQEQLADRRSAWRRWRSPRRATSKTSTTL